MSKATYFTKEWCDPKVHPEWATWLREASGESDKAMCLACSKTFALSNMAVQSIKSHSTGKKHLKNLDAMNKSVPITSFVRNPNTTPKLVDSKSSIDDEATEATTNNFTCSPIKCT